MAASILQALNFPSLVSSLEIDAAGQKSVASKNCSCQALQATSKGDGLTFQRCDQALPYFPPDA